MNEWENYVERPRESQKPWVVGVDVLKNVRRCNHIKECGEIGKYISDSLSLRWLWSKCLGSKSNKKCVCEELPQKIQQCLLAGVAQWIDWFNSQSGHVPGLQARSPVEGVQEATDWCFSPSFSPSLTCSLKINFKKVQQCPTRIRNYALTMWKHVL